MAQPPAMALGPCDPCPRCSGRPCPRRCSGRPCPRCSGRPSRCPALRCGGLLLLRELAQPPDRGAMIADTCAGQHWVHTLSAHWVGLGAACSVTGWVQGFRPMPGHSQVSMPPLQHIRFSPDWHAEQPQRAIGSYDPINRAHVRGRATQSGSARTWRLQGSSEGWYRRSAARKGRAVEASWRQRCRTWPDHVGANPV